MPKQVYFIKYGKANALIKSSQKTTRFAFVDEGEYETIYEGRIGNFKSFEAQFEAKLGYLGYKQGYFRKNIACVAIPNDTTPGDMRTIFGSFDYLGFTETYLIFEHLALARSLTTKFPDTRIFGMIDIGCSKIDMSVVEIPDIVKKTSFKPGREKIEKYLNNPQLSALLTQMIVKDAKWFFDDFENDRNFQAILTGGWMNQADFCAALQKELAFRQPIAMIEENDELVISGLESIWNSQSGKTKTESLLNRKNA